MRNMEDVTPPDTTWGHPVFHEQVKQLRWMVMARDPMLREKGTIPVQFDLQGPVGVTGETLQIVHE